MRIRSFLPTTIVAASIYAASSSKTDNGETGRQKSPDFDDGKSDSQNVCGLYMATSSNSLPGDHKWGVYAGKDIENKSPIGFGDLAIQLFNLMANNVWVNPETEEIEDDLDTNQLANIVDWFEQFVWVPNSSGGQFELDQESAKIITAIPGTGVLGGFNPKMTNADFNHSSAYHREAWNEFPGEAHPGRGAYSNYFNLEMASTEIIPAGREIFVHYGDNWEEESEKEKETLTKADYEKVDKTIKKMIEFFQKHDGKLDDESKQKIYEFLRIEVMDAAAGSEKSSQIRSLLPDDPTELQKILDDGGSFASKSPGSARTLEWLAENGMCMDNIKPGPSSIPYAGRGAFANRAIKEGNLVAPVPLIQLSDETVLDMHQLHNAVLNSEAVEEEDADPEYMLVRESSEVVGIQLLMNYCWGHPKSSTLFLPVGAVTGYINHAPSKDKINAKMIWSKHAESRQDLFEEPLPAFTSIGALVVEIVATRDIEEGEEVFIDYGDEWQGAWDRHVTNWNENKEDSWPMQALDFNQEHKTKPFRTIDDEPYPDNVMVKCFLMVKKSSGDEVEIDSEGRKIRIWSEADSGKTNLVSNNLFDCKIKSHYGTSDGHSYDILWDSGQSITLVKGVPHKAIVPMDKPEQGDQHVWNSFRHYISMGDIYPKAWQDFGEEEEENLHDGGEL